MIVVRVELHSAITGDVTEIARMDIANDGTAEVSNRGNYDGVIFRGRSREVLAQHIPQRTGRVTDYPRQAYTVWTLVARMLVAMGYK